MSFDEFLQRIVSKDAMIREISNMTDESGAVLLVRRVNSDDEKYVFMHTGDLDTSEAYMMAGCYMRVYDQIKPS
jgi:hypothetical protein